MVGGAEGSVGILVRHTFYTYEVPVLERQHRKWNGEGLLELTFPGRKVNLSPAVSVYKRFQICECFSESLISYRFCVVYCVDNYV